MPNESRDLLFVLLQYLLPQRLLSRWAGNLAESRHPLIKESLIRLFMQKFAITLDEAERSAIEDYQSFNDFFTRSLKPGSRPLPVPGARVLCSPADGVVSQRGAVSNGRIFQAKGQDFSLLELLGGDQESTERLQNGNFMTIYLSPRDYHRVHMPCAGRLIRMIHVPGELFSVNAATAQLVPRLFARNERVVCLFATDMGLMAVVLVGAMIVASIETVWAGRIAPRLAEIRQTDYPQTTVPTLAQGQEMGRFLLGSTVVLVMEPGRIDWLTAVQPESKLRMGEVIAEACLSSPITSSTEYNPPTPQ